MPGKVPPQWVQDMYAAATKYSAAPIYSAEYTKWAQEAFDILLPQAMTVGTVGLVPAVLIMNANLGNVPTANHPAFGHKALDGEDTFFFKN